MLKDPKPPMTRGTSLMIHPSASWICILKLFLSTEPGFEEGMDKLHFQFSSLNAKQTCMCLGSTVCTTGYMRLRLHCKSCVRV